MTTPGILLADVDKYEATPFPNLVPYDLPWDLASSGHTINAKIPKARRFTLTSYSVNGPQRSKDGKTVFIQMDSPKEQDLESTTGLLQAAKWITQTCTEFFTVMERYIYTQLKISQTSSTLKVWVSSGLPQLAEAKDPFSKSMTFFPSGKFSKFFKYEAKQQKEIKSGEMMEKKNSFFRLDLTISYFEIRYVGEEHAIYVKCYCNVPRLTYLNATLPDLDTDRLKAESWEDRAAQEIEKDLQALQPLLTKKRKLEVLRIDT